MSVYIIVDGDMYLGMRSNTYIPVCKITEAKKFNSINNANNILRSSVPKILRINYNWTIKEMKQNDNSPAYDLNTDKTNNQSTQNVQYTPVKMDDLKESINDLALKLSTLYSNKDWLLQEESNIDKQISDVLHYIENEDKVSACDGFKLYKLLKLMRRYRRRIKDELLIIQTTSLHTCDNIAKGHTLNSLTGLDNRTYAPRVLNELFEDNSAIDSLIRKYTELTN